MRPQLPTMKRPATSSHYVVVTTLLAVATAAAIVLAAITQEPGQWHWDDWASVGITAVVGVLFGVLAWIVGRRQGQVIEGVANATLRDKAGAMGTDSLRVICGPLDLSLHIGRDALSAMPLFSLAGAADQQMFAYEVVASYSSLLLNSFPKSTSLPLGSIRRVHDDGDRLAESLEHVVVAGPTEEAIAVGSFIRQCLEIDEAGRRLIASEGVTRVLPLPQHFIPMLYADELLVYHNWNADHMDETHHAVELRRGLAEVATYYAPWYIGSDGTSEVDYTGARRADSRTHDPATTCDLPRWPNPLTHRQVLSCREYRHDFIRRMEAHLAKLREDQGAPPSFALLVYQLPDGSRMILDGNHRLSAALRLEGPTSDLLLYCFVVGEGLHPPSSDEQVVEHKDAPPQMYRGFNPDVERLRTAVAVDASRSRGHVQRTV